MATPEEDDGQGYESLYEEFDSPLQQQLRREAYGEDIDQHSWVTAEELRGIISALKLSSDSRLLDLGCGPAGPLCFVVRSVACHGAGVDVSPHAISAGRARVAAHDLNGAVTLREHDLNLPLPFSASSFDAVLSLDVILHLRDRLSTFREVARILHPGGRFLFTDAAVITGAISDEEVRWRCIHGHTQFAPPGVNEEILQRAGLKVIDRQDRTSSLLRNAAGRLQARLGHREELERFEGNVYFERQLQYLETSIELSQRGALSRIMYVTERLG